MILGRTRYATLEAVLLKERDQLLENLHPMPIDLPRKSITEAFRVGMNRIPVGWYFGGGAIEHDPPAELVSVPLDCIYAIDWHACSNWFGHRRE
jgi:hypothetical protein